jgi:four helix bundle suffix protein
LRKKWWKTWKPPLNSSVRSPGSSLIHQTNYLLDQQIAALERDFIREGGYSEQLAAARLQGDARARRI